jgi:hypothetical protein
MGPGAPDGAPGPIFFIFQIGRIFDAALWLRGDRGMMRSEGRWLSTLAASKMRRLGGQGNGDHLSISVATVRGCKTVE